MIVLVTGGRAFNDAALVDQVLGGLRGVATVVEGGASGADRLARQWARGAGVRCVTMPARWRDRDGTYDPGAGFKRNAEMLATMCPDVVVAFPGGRGTADMIARATRAGVEVRRVTEWDALLG